MPIDFVTKFQPYVDEQFTTESKKALLTNTDFDWTGAHTVKIYKISTSTMNDYGRSGPETGNWSRYGPIAALDATTEEFALTKDRSFTFAIDKLDTDETAQQLAAAAALARQNREVVIPIVTDERRRTVTPKQQKALLALLTSPTREKAAAAAGITSKTLRSYLALERRLNRLVDGE